MRRAMTAVTATVAALAGLAAAGGAAGVPGEAAYEVRAGGEFAAAGGGSSPKAVTYDEELVSPGAWIGVVQRVADGGMVIGVAVEGVAAGHTYGVHVHTGTCTADPADAGGHYQHAPGEEPWRATPRNEVWLDFTADVTGRAARETRQDWVFREGEARSVVLHEHATQSGGGHHGGTPGDAGARVACLTVPFAGD